MGTADTDGEPVSAGGRLLRWLYLPGLFVLAALMALVARSTSPVKPGAGLLEVFSEASIAAMALAVLALMLFGESFRGAGERERRKAYLPIVAGLSLLFLGFSADALDDFYATGTLIVLVENTGVPAGAASLTYGLYGWVAIRADRERAIEGAREELLRSEERYRTLVETSPVGIFKTNVEGDILFFNEALKELFGFDSVEQLEERGGVPSRYRDPEDREDLFELLRGEGVVRNFEAEMLTRDGEIIDVLLSASLDEEELTGYLVDITERRRREVELSRVNRVLRVLSTVNRLLVEAEDEERFVDDVCRNVVEEGGYRFVWVGYGEGGRVRPVASGGHGDGFLEEISLSFDAPPDERCPFTEAIQTGSPQAIRDIEAEADRYLWSEAALDRGYRSCVSLPLDFGGGDTGAIAIYSGEPEVFDENELKFLGEVSEDVAYGVRSIRTKRAREHAEEELQVLDRVLRHNMRNELNVITGHAELLEGKVEGPELSESLKSIRETAEEMLDRNEKSRRVREAYSGKEQRGGSLDATDLVEDAVEDARERYPGAEIETEIPEECPVYADEVLKFAVEELVGNAVESNDQETPWVRVSIESVEEKHIDLVVADDGPGIPEEEKAPIVEGEETALKHSSGIGLWLVKWFAELHGGEILFEEREPRGSVVRVRMDRAD